MTGFARREFAGLFGTLVCEIRSVNHRFLDATLRLPDSCRALEPELRQALARELRRGKIDCTLQQRAVPAGGARLEIDQEALERLLARVNELDLHLFELAADEIRRRLAVMPAVPERLAEFSARCRELAIRAG